MFAQTLGMDFIAWNPLADAVTGFSALSAGRCNSALHMFLDRTARDFYVEWTLLAEALLRMIDLVSRRRSGRLDRPPDRCRIRPSTSATA